jgi:hypothetical protein
MSLEIQNIKEGDKISFLYRKNINPVSGDYDIEGKNIEVKKVDDYFIEGTYLDDEDEYRRFQKGRIAKYSVFLISEQKQEKSLDSIKTKLGTKILEIINENSPEEMVDLLTSILNCDIMDQHDTIDELVGSELSVVLSSLSKIESF